MDSQLAGYLLGIMMALGISFFCAYQRGQLDKNTFMASFAVAIAVMCWIPILPFYMIALSVALIVIMLLSGGNQI